MKKIFTLAFILISYTLTAQSVISGIPDSASNISFPGSTGQYTISNPLVVSGTTFSNPPIAMACFSNCKSDYLFFHDFDLNIPLTATILGIEVIHNRGGCNMGSYVIDTLYLANQTGIISSVKRDSTASGIDTLGNASDMWGAVLSPAIINNSNFGVYVQTTGTGICTFGQFMLEMKVHYTNATSLMDVQKSNTHSAYIVSNPSQNSIELNSKENLIGEPFEIYDITGRRIYKGKIDTPKMQINVNQFCNGLYFIKIKGIQTLSFSL